MCTADDRESLFGVLWRYLMVMRSSHDLGEAGGSCATDVGA